MSRVHSVAAAESGPGGVRPPAPAESDWSPVELDRHARWALLPVVGVGLTGAFLWGLLQLLASVKLHAPGLFATQGWLGYGRLQPAAWNWFVFGFAVPTGLAVGAWMTMRLCRRPLLQGVWMPAGALVWLGGVVLGTGAVLAGRSTGVEGLEMPALTAVILLASYVLMAAPLLMTFFARRQSELYPSQWYILAAVVAFPWLYGAALLHAVVRPGRGVLPEVAASWFVHGMMVCWCGGLALAVALYLVPKILERPLPSRNLAVFGFWMLVFAGPLGGMIRRADGPFPAWLTSLGMVGCVLLLVGGYAVVVNLGVLVRGRKDRVRQSVTVPAALFAAAAFLLWNALVAVGGFQVFHWILGYTLFEVGLDWLLLWGAFGVSVLAALVYMVPRLVGRDWAKPVWLRWQLRTTMGAVLLLTLACGIGGWVHGAGIRDAATPYAVVARRIVPFIGLGTLAFLTLWLGVLHFIVQYKWLLWQHFRAHGLPVLRSWLRPEPARRSVREAQA